MRDAQIPEPLQELALSRAIDLLAGDYRPAQRQRLDEDAGGSGQDSQAAGLQDPGAGESDEQALYRKMSEGTGVPVEQLERLVHIDAGAVHVYLKKGDLPQKAAAAQKAITLIIVIATHYLTGEEEVDLSAARDECKEFNVFDGNYSTNIDSIENFKATGPRGGNKKVKVRKALIHSFKNEMVKLGLLAT
ncbi:hypothetical protein [Mycobacterium intracellulare]|uniref:hypothetical protein n=1 Tax=Mycobacterium intracellulare TaxID=1767 RepID=UPI001915DE77|nr:hypothetical protein [Mycobacterium intracellulare]